MSVDPTVATPAGAGGGGETFTFEPPLKKSLATDFVGERGAEVDQLIKDKDREGLSVDGQRLLTAQTNKGFLQSWEGLTPTLGREAQPRLTNSPENVEAARRLRASMAQALDHVRLGKEIVLYGYLCANSAEDRFRQAVNAVTDKVISAAAIKSKEGTLTEEDAKLVNEVAIMKQLTIEDFMQNAESVKEFTVMKHMVVMANRVSELGRITLGAVLTAPVHRRFVTLAKDFISKNGDVESVYQMTSPVGRILDNLENVGRARTYAGLEAARKVLTQARVPWASLDKHNGVRSWIEGEFMDAWETFKEEHRKIVCQPGYESVPGEVLFWALLRAIGMGGPHQNSANFSKASQALPQTIFEAENLIYDAGGNRMSVEQRYDILVQKLYKLDEGASWKAELKNTGQGYSKPGGGRGAILNVREGKERKTTTKAIRDICFSNLHKGVCSKGDKCGFVHLTSAQRKVYPVCTDKRCTRGNGCMFRHPGDEINLAAEEPESGGSGSTVKTGGGQSKQGKEEPTLRLIQVLEGSEEEEDGEETN